MLSNFSDHTYSLSYYKEMLAGESENYVTFRASAEMKTPIAVTQQLSEELLQALETVKLISCSNAKLGSVLRSYLMVRVFAKISVFL